MDFKFDSRREDFRENLLDFMDTHVHPAEEAFHEQLEALDDPWAWDSVALLKDLRDTARARKLTLRFADGSDEVHKNALAKSEIRRQSAKREARS